MRGTLLLQLFVAMAATSLMSVGGVGAIIPELHRQAVDLNGWMDDATFANLFAITQITPGPNFLIVSLIGLRAAGWMGLVVATISFILPSAIMAWYVQKTIHRFESSKVLSTIKAALIPLSLGLFSAGGVVICQLADHDRVAFALSGVGIAFTALFNRNPLWIIGVGALAGVVLY